MFSESLIKALENGENLDKAIEEEAAPMRELLDGLLKADPFVPFRLTLTAGTSYEIRHPEQMVVRPCVAAIREPDPTTGRLRECSLLALIHVVSVETRPPDQPILIQGE